MSLFFADPRRCHPHPNLAQAAAAREHGRVFHVRRGRHLLVPVACAAAARCGRRDHRAPRSAAARAAALLAPILHRDRLGRLTADPGAAPADRALVHARRVWGGACGVRGIRAYLVRPPLHMHLPRDPRGRPLPCAAHWHACRGCGARRLPRVPRHQGGAARVSMSCSRKVRARARMAPTSVAIQETPKRAEMSNSPAQCRPNSQLPQVQVECTHVSVSVTPDLPLPRARPEQPHTTPPNCVNLPRPSFPRTHQRTHHVRKM